MAKRGKGQPVPERRYDEQPRGPRVYIPPREPYHPAEYDDAEVQAIKALCEGRATSEQQRMGMRWIIEAAANYHDIDFRPGGLEGERASAFNSGRRFVGAQIHKLRTLNLAMLPRRDSK